jgi:hypothetical protein
MLPARLFAGFLLALGAVVAAAQVPDGRSAVTLYGAWRGGGSFVDAASNQTLRLDGSGAWAVSFERDLDGGRQLQFYVSHQSTHLGLDPSAAAGTPPGTNPAALPMKLTYFQVGGTTYVDGPVGRGPYVVGGLGATLFQPGTNGYSDEVRPSMNLGIGYRAPLGRHLALRFEARGYATLVNSSGGLFCSGGCQFKIKGDAVTQGEAQLGLSYLF